MAKIFEWFFNKFGAFIMEVLTKIGIKRAKEIAVIITLFVALVTAFIGFQQVIMGLIVAMIHVPDSQLWQSATWVVLPDCAPSCLSALITARVAKFGYMWLVWKTKKLVTGYGKNDPGF
ncbi:hypothetical protein BI343_09260 [Chromobacterium amazonense]|uniref:DUF5455 family protein n=1 Tax=Chromobacterium amazonense TaxID=1382803 RepID=UPI0008D92133|nr:DUF5455 family protein [Chromobacterium amazonense]MDE1715936.1 DUF5455 family protein [Chromobacterium amazonense]OHX18391.1 hypothetical protein BI343_09260 [Chromobacterium amazonense]